MITNGKFYTAKIQEHKYQDYSLQKCIEETCSYCIQNTYVCSEDKINKPIMMLGKIQSGKTRAFTGLIALAFDNNFDIVFILTKNSKALIQQTVTRMRKEFKVFIDEHEIVVTDIMKANSRISGYQLDQKNIIVAKKEKNNISKLIEFIKSYSINDNKRCLIIDDEADTTGIGYKKIKGSDEFTLRMVSSKINEMRGTLDGCVFVEVTATPYALYLQPEFDENGELQPIKPMKTILVPFGKDYIGGDYYFLESTDKNHPASYLFEPMSQDEHELISIQKRKGKKSKINDRRSFKEEEILINKDRLPVFKKGIVNFIVGGIVLRDIYKTKNHYAYVIHTATQQGSHVSLQKIAETLLIQIKSRNTQTIPIIEDMLRESYDDLTKSVSAYGFNMPNYDFVKQEFYLSIDKEYYSIDVVNGDQEVENLLNEETGELNLTTPFSIFVGGQVLDRGVTIPNMIGFYYGRNPKSMQQDTVLQHSRMFGYRNKLLPVTRFYTTERIHSNMEKITEIDIALREDIESGKQGNGVYFITSQEQEKLFGTGGIKPCSPDKIRVSDIILLKAHRRILPVGFSPVIKSMSLKLTDEIEKILNTAQKNVTDAFILDIDNAEALLTLVYSTFKKDDDEPKYVELSEFLTSLRYFCKECDLVYFTVYRNMKISKYKENHSTLQDSPDTSKSHLEKAKSIALNSPCVMLFQEDGNSDDWGYRPFWWPVLVAPKNIPKTIFAAKVAGEKIRF